MRTYDAIGLTSVTFRKKTIEEVAELASRAGLSLVEWGGDVHVAPGDGEAVKRAREAMKKYELRSPSYGSYYRIGDGNLPEADKILTTARALDASTVRFWLGRKPSGDCTEKDRAHLIAETRAIADLAAPLGLTVAFEFHGGTYNDTGSLSAAFIEDVGKENVRTYWQPLAFGDAEANLCAVLPHLSTVHVFSWDKENNRYPFAEGADRWRRYFALLKEKNAHPNLIMEFVLGDDPKQFLTDAEDLKRMAFEIL